MKISNIMEKGNMMVSNANPLVKQIQPSEKIKDEVYITYNICETCNLNCLFCCINDTYHGYKSISKKNSDIILEQIKNKYIIDTIFIMANEPTTQPDLANHIIKYAITNNIKIKIVSNGFAPITIYQRMLLDINPKSINKITISLDSMDEKTHNYIRNNNNSFFNTIRTIKYLKNNGYNIRVQMTVCDINYNTIIDSIKELNYNYNITNFAFHCMSVSDRAIKNGLKHVSAFKWRRLVTNLFALKYDLKNIEEFSVPIVAMTENELLRMYFGNNRKLLDKFKRRESLQLCPAINGNNIYLKATDDDVYLSKCQILFDNIGNYSYKFNYDKNFFNKNIRNNDYNIIEKSKTLCPVILTELKSKEDFEQDENGNKLYYVCRVLLANEKDLDF